MSCYDNQQQYHGTNDEMHRQHYFNDRQHQQIDAMHSSSDASSKSEKQTPNFYHQQNGFLMKLNGSQSVAANNNECEPIIADSMQQKITKQTNNKYGKILNCNKLTGKEHRNGTRPIPRLPSPPSTPPPPLSAKTKDYHDSSNKFYQEFQSNMNLSNQQQNPFNGNDNINNNNEVAIIGITCITWNSNSLSLCFK